MENQRFAVDIGVTLSGNLINACLTMLTIVGAIFIFIIEKRTTSPFFYILISLSFLSFIFSVICGGKGIDAARKKAVKDKLKLKYTKKHFNIQAITCLFGVLFFIGSIFCTTEKQDETVKLIKMQQQLIESFRLQYQNEHFNDSIKLQINLLKKDIEKLKK